MTDNRPPTTHHPQKMVAPKHQLGATSQGEYMYSIYSCSFHLSVRYRTVRSCPGTWMIHLFRMRLLILGFAFILVFPYRLQPTTLSLQLVSCVHLRHLRLLLKLLKSDTDTYCYFHGIIRHSRAALSCIFIFASPG